MTTIVIAVDMDDGQAWVDAQPAPATDVLIVTPRSRDRARGVTAAAIYATPAAMDHPVYRRLLDLTMPSVMARP